MNTNIKYLMYSRYSTSIPIFFVNQDQSNKTITTDADKVPLLSQKDDIQDKGIKIQSK